MAYEEKIVAPVIRELVKFSDAALERGYKVSYEIAEENLPQPLAREVERQLRISTDNLKRENAKNLNEATVELLTSTTATLIDVASRTLATQSGSVIKSIILERDKKKSRQRGQTNRRRTHGAGQAKSHSQDRRREQPRA